MILGYKEICEIIEHRPPFLLVDKVLELNPYKNIVAQKCISAMEPCFQGHFPGEPIYPGVLLVEGLAQCAAILAGKSIQDFKLMRCVLTSITNVRFRRKVIPGDILSYEVFHDKNRGSFFWFSGKVFVGEEIAVEAQLSARFEEKECKYDNSDSSYSYCRSKGPIR